MKKIVLVAVLALLVSQVSTRAQTQPPSSKTLAATMGVYVFPTNGQLTDEQSIDEAKCYEWAVQNTGTDPFQLDQADGAAEEGRRSGQEAGVTGDPGLRGQGCCWRCRRRRADRRRCRQCGEGGCHRRHIGGRTQPRKDEPPPQRRHSSRSSSSRAALKRPPPSRSTTSRRHSACAWRQRSTW